MRYVADECRWPRRATRSATSLTAAETSRRSRWILAGACCIRPGCRPCLGVLVLLHWLMVPGLRPVQAQPASPAPAAGSAEQDRLVQALRSGGLVVLIRHSATLPGVSDPPGFRMDDCPTQRNLSDAGRAQARRIGQWFRQHGIEPTVIRASPWCRTRETAMLAFGRSEDWPALSNLLATAAARTSTRRRCSMRSPASAQKTCMCWFPTA